MSVDPVPPPSERELERGLKGKDEETWTAVGLWRDLKTQERRIYILDQRASKGHTPDWSMATFLEMKNRWHPMVLKAESVNYQRTLAWLLEKVMRSKGQYMRIDAYIPERRKKSYRIIDTLGDALANGLLYFHKSQQPLIQQILNYPSVTHDDRIEGLAVAVAAVLDLGGIYEGDFEDIIEAERDIPDLPDVRLCP
jgi:predicted phage terminase large subunit-like protein